MGICVGRCEYFATNALAAVTSALVPPAPEPSPPTGLAPPLPEPLLELHPDATSATAARAAMPRYVRRHGPKRGTLREVVTDPPVVKRHPVCHSCFEARSPRACACQRA